MKVYEIQIMVFIKFYWNSAMSIYLLAIYDYYQW